MTVLDEILVNVGVPSRPASEFVFLTGRIAADADGAYFRLYLAPDETMTYVLVRRDEVVGDPEPVQDADVYRICLARSTMLTSVNLIQRHAHEFDPNRYVPAQPIDGSIPDHNIEYDGEVVVADSDETAEPTADPETAGDEMTEMEIEDSEVDDEAAEIETVESGHATGVSTIVAEEFKAENILELDTSANDPDVGPEQNDK